MNERDLGREGPSEGVPALEPLVNRLRKNARHRRKWAKRHGTDAWRAYDHDIPEYPVVVDIYGDYVHVLLDIGRGPGAHAVDAEAVVKSVEEGLGVARPDIFVKGRQRLRTEGGPQQYGREGTREEESLWTWVREGGLEFQVNLTDYHDTGLFLDHRLSRAWVAAQCKGKRVLNLFAYTGAFSVHAAKAGAERVVTVDWSQTYVQWAVRNFEANGLPPSEHEFVRGDARAYPMDLIHSGRGRREELGFDVVVVDPPTFSNSKRTAEVFDIKRDHVGLLRDVAAVLRDGGWIFFSTNSRKFRLDEEALAGWEIEERTQKTVPEDFKAKRPHRAWRLVPPVAG